MASKAFPEMAAWATNASLNGPQTVALDPRGGLYICDTYNNRIREVDTNGTITTMAGNGRALTNSGYSGNGGAATNASLNHPGGGALDAVGNLYIADSFNNCVRKVDTNGIMTTVAGNNSKGYSGDGGAATSASLDWPYSVALDAFGNLFIADTWNNRIRKVDTGGIVTTVAGNGTAGYSGDGGAATGAELNWPGAVGLDAVGNLYIADQGNNRIRKVDTNGIITTVAGNGTNGYSGDGGEATNASLNGPSGLGSDAIGNLYIADLGNSRIRQVDPNGIITTVAGNGIAAFSGDGGAGTNASLNNPLGVALDAAGDLYIADQVNQRIRKVDNHGIITTIAGNGIAAFSGDGGTATNASLDYPYSVALDATGNLYIPDTGNNRIREVNLTGYPTFTANNVSASNAGSYTVVITNLYGSVTSAVATLVVQAPPVITAPPASQVAVAGSSPIFSVTVAGSGPFGYSWYFDITNLLQSGASSTLALADVSANNLGNYTVVVTNAYGSVTSQIATLSLVVPPSGNTQPGIQTVLAGTNVAFSVAVDGTGPFSYQWQLNGTNLPNNIITTVAGNGEADYFEHLS